MDYKITENSREKILSSHIYNYKFDKTSGLFVRWGSTYQNNPQFSPFGPEIMDIEISTICSNNCSFCYKNNSKDGKNMSFETFQKIFSKLPKTVTQIAFGIGDITANKDIWKIFSYCKKNGVIPNTTINGRELTKEITKKLATHCGSVAVSHYNDEDCFNAVYELKRAWVKQVNIHKLLSKETYEDCFDLLDKVSSDQRLEDLDSIIFLTLKKCGKGRSLSYLKDTDKIGELVYSCFERDQSIGFDSCVTPLMLKALEKDENFHFFKILSDSCESTLFSLYVNVEGKVFPCSFSEHLEPIDLLKVEDFYKDCWFSAPIEHFRKKLLETAEKNDALIKGIRECPEYNLYRD